MTTQNDLYINKISSLLNGGEGEGATATATLALTGRIKSALIHDVGSGYSVGDILTIDTGEGNTPATFEVLLVGEAGDVLSVKKLTAGDGVSASSTDVATTVSPAAGTGCTLDYISEFQIASFTVTEEGTGYTGAVAVSVDSSGSKGVAQAVIVTEGVDDFGASTGWFEAVPTVTVVNSAPSPTDFATLLVAYDMGQQVQRLTDMINLVRSGVVGSLYNSVTLLDDVIGELSGVNPCAESGQT